MIKDRGILMSLADTKMRLDNKCEELETWLRDAPEGDVKVIRHRKGVQFYFRANKSDKNGKYMPKKSEALAHILVQKRYNQQLLKQAKKDSVLFSRFLKAYDPDDIIKLYEKTEDLRKPYIIPWERPDEEDREYWESMAYEGKDFADNAPEHFTDKNERVRSKSEVMIANALARADIPYRYECPLQLMDHVVYPDFTILRLRDRKEIFWEHFGLMDQADYAENALRKVRAYANSGIFLGDRLIITAETERVPINSTAIRQVINTYFK